MIGSGAMGSSTMATQQVAAAHGTTRGSAVTAVQRTAARPWQHGMQQCSSDLMGSSTLLHDTQPCTSNTMGDHITAA